MFQVKSGKLIITDPCYDKEPGNIVKATNGEWVASIKTKDFGDWGVRVVSLTAEVKYYIPNSIFLRSLDVGVDSGQAGIFDAAAYPEGSTGEFRDLSSFYGQACQLTNSDNDDRANYLGEIGFVSSTGFGDGCYNADVYGDPKTRAADKIVITFIDKEESEDHLA